MPYTTLVPETHARPYVTGDNWRGTEEAERVADNLDDHETRLAAVDAANSVDVTLAGSPNYLTLAGQVITRALIDLASHITGRLPFANLTAATAASKLFGRGSAGGAGDYEEITLGTNLSMSGATLNAAGGGGGSSTQGTYASLPGTCAVGDLYFFTDSVYAFARCNATNVWSFFLDGKLVTIPGLVSGWTTVNGAADFTATDAAGSIDLDIVRNASLNWRGLFKAQPSTPYTVTAFWKAQQLFANSQISGVYFYDGTKLMGVEFLTQASGVSTLRVEKITNVTTDGSAAASHGTFAGATPYYGGVWVRLTNNGAASTLVFDFSLDGRTWHTLFSEAIGTHLTPTHYGFAGVNQAASGNLLTMSLQAVTLG